MILERYIDLIRAAALFRGIGDPRPMLQCLDARVKNVPKSDVVLLTGERPRAIGLLLSGDLRIVKEDSDGNRTLIAGVLPGETYAEALCCAGVEKSPVTVLAGEDSEVMLLRYESILGVCPNACGYHTKLIGNMLSILAEKSMYLEERVEVLAIKSIRAKALRYLESFAPRDGREFAIPFNREGLADYLGVERSALSHELARMKRDGLIDYNKNRFIVK